jgi:hypothetical protein
MQLRLVPHTHTRVHARTQSTCWCVQHTPEQLHGQRHHKHGRLHVCQHVAPPVLRQVVVACAPHLQQLLLLLLLLLVARAAWLLLACGRRPC